MSRTWNWLVSMLVKVQESSMMLVDVIGDELEAPIHTNSVQSSAAMDASIFAHSSICHDFLYFHVQILSTVPQDDEWIN